MCGIAGFTTFRRSPRDQGLLFSMGEKIAHRGPDAHGEYLNDKVGLSHRRLSILDLSPLGNQPMASNTGNEIIAFNGEIYNFMGLREEAIKDGYPFKSKSDTEVILAMYQKYGLGFVEKLNGMFAIALWDEAQQLLVLARDRLGKKPLYYHQDANGDIVFGSEIKAILAVPGITKKIRHDAIYDYFNYQYVPDPKTIFHDIHKLPPAHLMTVSKDGISIKEYWNVSFKEKPVPDQEAEDSLYSLLEECVTQRMVSDVPLGAFLSGGIDSSAVVALMANNSETPITTCSIGFDSKKYDEVEFANIVAQKYRTDHHEFTVKDTVQEKLKEIASFFDEPFADPSFVPTYFVSGLARQKVTVALAGDGGDENFAGYGKYRIDQIENKLRNRVPGFIRRSILPWLIKPVSKTSQPLVKKAVSLLTTISREPDYGFFVTNSFFREHLWDSLTLDSFKKDLAGYHPFEVTRQHYQAADTDDHLSKILYTDIKTYLAGDILVKVDRMSMAHSLETRAPILDYRMVEYAASLNSSQKLRDTEKKYVLKKAFERELPHDILYRKKMGFSVPLADWLKVEIRQIAEQTLFRKNSGLSNYFDMKGIRALWDKHISGVADFSQELWSLLVFELWWMNYMDPDAPGEAIAYAS